MNTLIKIYAWFAGLVIDLSMLMLILILPYVAINYSFEVANIPEHSFMAWVAWLLKILIIAPFISYRNYVGTPGTKLEKMIK